MSLIHEMEWNKVFEFTWRILVFLVAIAVIIVIPYRPTGPVERGRLATDQ